MSYLGFWGLDKNPFDSVPDPSMYFSSHATVESAVAEILFAINEGNECLAVITGEVGLGKTTALRVVLNELDLSRYRVSFVTNPSVTFPQLMREIIGQLEGEKCVLRTKEDLLERFNELLFETADQGGKVLVFIDEGNAMPPANMEGLRLLTNLQEDDRNLMTLVVAGQPKLARMLEKKERANLFQRIGVYSKLEPLASTENVKSYIEHRLQRAGALKPIFEESAYAAIYEHSQGVPRLINRVCKLSLKAAETNHFPTVSAELVRSIASRFERGKSPEPMPEPFAANRPSVTEEPATTAASRLQAPEMGEAPEAPAVAQDFRPAPTTPEIEVPDPQASHDEPQRTASPQVPVEAIDAASLEEPAATVPEERFETAVPKVAAEAVSKDNVVQMPSVNRKVAPQSRACPLKDLVASPSSPGTAPHAKRPAGGSKQEPLTISLKGFSESPWEVPDDAVTELKGLPSRRDQLRFAGELAARELNQHPEKYSRQFADLVEVWDALRTEILRAVG